MNYTSVIELADELYKSFKSVTSPVTVSQSTLELCKDVQMAEKSLILSRVCSNANDVGLPLSVVQQLLKGTGYEQLLS